MHKAHEQRGVLAAGRVAQGKAHEEAIQLGFRQREGALNFDGVLCSNDEEGIRQAIRLAAEAHLTLLHAFEQRGLRARRGAVELVAQKHGGENRALFKHEFRFAGVIQARAGDVARQQVGRTLYAREIAAQQARHRTGEHRLAGAGHILQKHVTTCKQRADEQTAFVFLADHDSGRIFKQGSSELRYGRDVDHAGILLCYRRCDEAAPGSNRLSHNYFHFSTAMGKCQYFR